MLSIDETFSILTLGRSSEMRQREIGTGPFSEGPGQMDRTRSLKSSPSAAIFFHRAFPITYSPLPISPCRFLPLRDSLCASKWVGYDRGEAFCMSSQAKDLVCASRCADFLRNGVSVPF